MKLDDKLEKIPSLEVFDLSEENELDTYMSREVLVLEGDEAQILTPKELGQGQEDHCLLNHGSHCTISVFPKTPKMFDSLTKLFEWKNIIRKMTFRNQLNNVKIHNVETIQSYFTRVSQIKEQIEAVK